VHLQEESGSLFSVFSDQRVVDSSEVSSSLFSYNLSMPGYMRLSLNILTNLGPLDLLPVLGDPKGSKGSRKSHIDRPNLRPFL